MGERFPDFYGEWIFEPGSVTDLWAWCLAVVLVVTWRIARRQFAIMKEQDKAGQRMETLAADQNRLIAKQERLLAENRETATRLEAITKRQGEIAETPHQIMQEQLAKVAKLRIRIDVAQRHHAPETIIAFEVFNEGNKTARGFHWELLVDDSVDDNVHCVSHIDGTTFPVVNGAVFEFDVYTKFEGYREEALFPQTGTQVGNIQINTSTVNDVPVALPLSKATVPGPQKPAVQTGCGVAATGATSWFVARRNEATGGSRRPLPSGLPDRSHRPRLPGTTRGKCGLSAVCQSS